MVGAADGACVETVVGLSVNRWKVLALGAPVTVEGDPEDGPVVTAEGAAELGVVVGVFEVGAAVGPTDCGESVGETLVGTAVGEAEVGT